RLFTAGKLDQAGYQALRDVELERTEATQRALDGLRARAERPRRDWTANVDQVIARAGQWSEGVAEAATLEQRAVLDQMVERIVIDTNGWRKLKAEIIWTEFGKLLGGAALQDAA